MTSTVNEIADLLIRRGSQQPHTIATRNYKFNISSYCINDIMSPFSSEQETNELIGKCDAILAEHPGNRCCKYLKEYVKSDEFAGLSEAGECN